MASVVFRFAVVAPDPASEEMPSQRLQPRIADWGITTCDGTRVLSGAPQGSAIPRVVPLLVALASDLVGGGLRDALHPRLRP